MEASACQRGALTLLLRLVLLLSAPADGGLTSHPSSSSSTIGVSAPHQYHSCPEGATVSLSCAVSGALLHPTDSQKRSWLFTPHADQHCSGREGPRHMVMNPHPHTNHPLPTGLHFTATEKNFLVTLENLTRDDQGRYCCLLLDVDDHKHVVQKTHSHVVLMVSPRRNGSQECTTWDATPPGGLAPVVVAATACVVALLALPLILLLVYKQRNSHNSRRGQELVRMDSEAQGHDNPVFFSESPQPKPRTVSQIMTRQSSETGRHLLSDPGTPLSPPAHGDVFFPTEDTIPESPDLVQV